MNIDAMLACTQRKLSGVKVVPAYDPQGGYFVLRGEQGRKVMSLDALTDLWQCDPTTAKDVALTGGAVWSSLCDDMQGDAL